MLKRIHALRPIGDRRLYFQSLLYNMRGFCLYTHFPLHTPYPILPRARQDHVAGAVPPLLDAHQVAQVSWSATVHLSASTGAAL